MNLVPGRKYGDSLRPCPHHGVGKDRECKATAPDRLLCKKARPGAIRDGWELVKAVSSGPGGMLLRWIGDRVGERSSTTTPAVLPQINTPPEMAADPEPAITFEEQELRNKRAQALMRSLSLEPGDEFETELRRRLTAGGIAIDVDEEIARLRSAGLRTLRPGRYSAAAGLAGLQPDGTYTGPVVGLIPATANIGGKWKVTGFQVWRSPEVQATYGGGKYQQLSRGRGVEDDNYLSVRLAEGQSDNGLMYFYDPHNAADRPEPEVLLLTDSSLKPYVTGARLGKPVAGSPGMQYSRVGNQLRQLLTRVCGTGAERKPVVLCPDAGDLAQPQIFGQLISIAMEIQTWGWQPMVGWWDQEKKDGGLDVDEVAPGQVQLITVSDLLSKAQALVQQMATRSASQSGMLGFRPKKPNDVLETPFEVAEPEIYQEGDFEHVFKKKLEQGFRIVVNRAFTGAGKSARTSRMVPASYGVRYIRWLTSRHMPQADEFSVPFLSGKNHGLKRRANGELGVMRYKDDVQEGEKAVRGPNCHRIEELTEYNAKRMDLMVSSVCGACAYKPMCEAVSGGYRYERAEALKAPVVAVHPSSFMSMFVSMSEEQGIKASDTGAVIDEFNVGAFLDNHGVGQVTLRALQETLEQHGRSPRMQGLVLQLGALLGSDEAMFTDAQLRRELLQWLGPLQQMSRSEWEALQIWEENRARADELQVCLVAHLRDWVLGEAVMCLEKKSLHLVRRNNRLLKAIAACKWVLVHDATVAVREVAALIANEGEEIAVIAQDVPDNGAEVDVWQLTGAGRLGFRRTSDAQFGVVLALQSLKERGHLPATRSAIVDTKASLESTGAFAQHSLAWLVDNRGSNRAADADVLTGIGAPVANLRALADRYTLLFGTAPDLRQHCSVIYGVMQAEGEREMVCVVPGSADVDFRRYVHHTTQAEITQARGRLREYRRCGEMLRMIVITDYPMPFSVNLTDLQELPGWAKAKSTLTQGFVVHTITTMRSKGLAADRDALCERLGLARSTLDLWMSTRSDEEVEEINAAAGLRTAESLPSAHSRRQIGAVRCTGAKPAAA